jgi:hypothetical protein
MRRLVWRYGAERVFNIGLEVLGFPPNWSFPSKDQVEQLYRAFHERV